MRLSWSEASQVPKYKNPLKVVKIAKILKSKLISCLHLVNYCLNYELCHKILLNLRLSWRHLSIIVLERRTCLQACTSGSGERTCMSSESF